MVMFFSGTPCPSGISWFVVALSVQMAWRSQLMLLLALEVYVMLGGVVFHVLEFRHHVDRIEEEDALQELARDFIG